MLRYKSHAKCSRLDYDRDCSFACEGLLNPYCFDFGGRYAEESRGDFNKIYHNAGENEYSDR